MYGPEILDLFDLLGPFSLGATAESWAQDGCRRDQIKKYYKRKWHLLVTLIIILLICLANILLRQPKVVCVYGRYAVDRGLSSFLVVGIVGFMARWISCGL